MEMRVSCESVELSLLCITPPIQPCTQLASSYLQLICHGRSQREEFGVSCGGSSSRQGRKDRQDKRQRRLQNPLHLHPSPAPACEIGGFHDANGIDARLKITIEFFLSDASKDGLH